ncbi:MAG: TRAP transporter substrate-binding protein DctP [Halobacteriovoraceae bacterium]|nr:TRAP transporter substrate-binding protein DctP [Halobacteriovoraceae bacterium]
MKKILILVCLIFTTTGFAEKLKVGVLAPEGTTWAINLKKMSKEIKDATEGNVNLKFYFGGSQGDEIDVLRKIRTSNLHGGVFTGKTLGEIYGDARVLEIPFTFERDREKAFSTMKALEKHIDDGFAKSEFKSLGHIELGMVYFVSQKEITTLDGLQGIKIWSWEGDQLVNSMLTSMNLVSVPLTLPDVLSSLSNGVIHAAYGPPLGIVAMQWQSKVKFLIDYPLAYSTGAFLLSSKAWSKIPTKYQSIVEGIAKKYVDQINSTTVQENIDALAAIKASGVQFIKISDKDIAYGKKIRSEVIKKLEGDLFSKKSLDLLQKQLL